MSLAQPIREALSTIAGSDDEAIDVFVTGLLFAALERPVSGFESYRVHVAQMAEDVLAAAAQPGSRRDPLAIRIGALSKVIAGHHGYQGEKGPNDTMGPSNLIEVIEKRRGSPTALGVIYMTVARMAGWSMDALAFPAHFLVRLDMDGRRAILDPFQSGAVVRPEHLRGLLKEAAGPQAELSLYHWADLGPRGILYRLQNETKLRLLQHGKIAEVLPVVEAAMLFSPDEVGLLREAGLINARLGRLPTAIEQLEAFLDRCPNDAARRHASAVLDELRERLGA